MVEWLRATILNKTPVGWKKTTSSSKKNPKWSTCGPGHTINVLVGNRRETCHWLSSDQWGLTLPAGVVRSLIKKTCRNNWQLALTAHSTEHVSPDTLDINFCLPRVVHSPRRRPPSHVGCPSVSGFQYVASCSSQFLVILHKYFKHLWFFIIKEAAQGHK